MKILNDIWWNVMEWFYLAQYRDSFWALVNAVTNIWNLLTSWQTASFSDGAPWSQVLVVYFNIVILDSIHHMGSVLQERDGETPRKL